MKYNAALPSRVVNIVARGGSCRQRHMTTLSRIQSDRLKASEPRIMIRQLTQEYPYHLTGQFKYTFDGGLAYHGKSLIYRGYLRKGTPDGCGSGQQPLIFGGLHDGAPAACAELFAQMVNMAAHGVRRNHQGFGDFLVGAASG
jgi:hypothetical protein